MVAIGIGITLATVAALVVGFFTTRRRRAFPAHGWLGLAALAGAEWLMFHGVEPVATFFTPIAWSAYILIADGAVLALTNRSRLNDAPVTVARMALLSVPLWLIFEAYNLRLRNWVYTGVPAGWTGALLRLRLVVRDDHAGHFRDLRPGAGDSSAAARERRGKFPRAAENVLIGLRGRLPGSASGGAAAPRRLFISARVDRLYPAARSGEQAPGAAFVSWAIFPRDSGGASTDFFSRDGSAAGCGSSGTTGRRRNGTTFFPSGRDGKFSRCPRPAISAFCRLRWNVS